MVQTCGRLFLLVAASLAADLAAVDAVFPASLSHGVRSRGLAESHVINGVDAATGEFPYQVSLQRVNKILFWELKTHFCGGTILSSRWVLTAAHCIRSEYGIRRLDVVAGITRMKGDEEVEQRVQVDGRFEHEQYAGGVMPFDIGLLHLGADLVFNDRVQPARLPAAGALPAGVATASGWGLSHSGFFSWSPNTLQKMVVPIVDFDTCRDMINTLVKPSPFNQNKLDVTNVCTGPTSGDVSGVSACNGDSGGPLALPQPQVEDVDVDVDGRRTRTAVVVGVVSWTLVPCGREGAPTVFTRVSAYNDWIHKHINNSTFNSPSKSA